MEPALAQGTRRFILIYMVVQEIGPLIAISLLIVRW
jgi:hypothetical protein